jgi:hypothetical protein
MAVLGMVLLIWGVSLAIPRRSHDFEELLSECRLSSGTAVRFYRGNVGFGHSFSYEVYVQPGGPLTEEMVFYTYREPALRAVECQGLSFEIVGYAESFRLDANAPPSELAGSLRDQLHSHRGNPSLPYLDQLRIVFGGFVVALGLAFVTWYSRRRPPQVFATKHDDFAFADIAIATFFDLPHPTSRRFVWLLLPIASAISNWCFSQLLRPHADLAVTGPLFVSLLCCFIGLAPRAITTVALGALSGALTAAVSSLAGSWITDELGTGVAGFGPSIAIPASLAALHYVLDARRRRMARSGGS